MKRRKHNRDVPFARLPCTIIFTLLCAFSFMHPNIAEETKPFAQGNLFVIYNAPSGRSSEVYPIHDTELSDLWCEATRDKKTRINIGSARFVQILPRPYREYRAHITDDQRAYLHFPDKVTPLAAGVYRCEIITTEKELVVGNLFVYLRPIFHINGTMDLNRVDDDQPFTFSAPSVKITRGEVAQLLCPALSYPPPIISWFHNSKKIDTTDTARYRLYPNGELHIIAADDFDEGLYECIAENSFPLKIDGDDHTFRARLQQQLQITNSLSWLIPLLVIVIIVLLLFIIIYTCAWWKRRQHAQYHVAKKERCLPTVEDADNDVNEN